MGMTDARRGKRRGERRKRQRVEREEVKLAQRGNEQESSGQAKGRCVKSKYKNTWRKREIVKTSEESREGVQEKRGGKVKEGSRRAGERPQLAFLRFRCGTIAAYQSVST